jgi:L-ascorbate metabolism protein UlaG (beta-lactamase superfamily)
MEIKWLGHSCFRLRGKAATIITDPYSPQLGYKLGKVTADIVTMSHQHPGHNYLKGVGGHPRAVKGPGEYEISEVIIIGIAAFHDASQGSSKGRNTVYLMEMDEVSICHLGDLGHMLTDDEVEELGEVDILILPVGGLSTIDAATAAQVVRQLDPKVVIPMHYQTPELDRGLAPVDAFLKEGGVKDVTPQSKLLVTKSNLPLTTQVVVLEY